jgi:hypothetical protein
MVCDLKHRLAVSGSIAWPEFQNRKRPLEGSVRGSQIGRTTPVPPVSVEPPTGALT